MSKKIFIIQILIVVFVLFVFYISFKVIFDSIDRYNVSVIKKQILFSLSDDIAEGNLFKLGYTFSKLKKEGIISNGLIVEIKGRDHKVIYQISESDDFYDYHRNINCKLIEENDVIRKTKNKDTVLITKLPYNFGQEKCQVLLIKYSQSRGIKNIYFKSMIIFMVLTFASIVVLLTLSNIFYKRLLEFKLEKQRLIYEKDVAFSNLAVQVAHDIRSPLSVLEIVLKRSDKLPSEYRDMVAYSLNRIRYIANNLLDKYKLKDKPKVDNGLLSENNQLYDAHLVSSIIEEVINEKQIEYENKKNIEIKLDLGKESYGLFAKIEPVEFSRAISNLINNSVEAIEGKGYVRIFLYQEKQWIIVKISDNGKGIPAEVLNRLGQKGFSYGKTGGSGLGIFHARTIIEKWGGTLDISSELSKGTDVIIKLPKADRPEWFANELIFCTGEFVVVLDDDKLIHQIWYKRFQELNFKNHNIDVIFFNEPYELMRWLEVNKTNRDNAKYLFDYDLAGYEENGISISTRFGIYDKTVLVSNYYDNKDIIEVCKIHGIKIIPKSLIYIVPIKINKYANLNFRSTAVLIDDDKLTQMNWKMEAKLKGINLIVFDNPNDFLIQADKFSKDTPIYIDSELGETKGEDLARELYNRGFKDVTLETGYTAEKFSHLPWLKIIDKTPPWK